MSFKSCLRHRSKPAKSVFTGWHSLEIFAIPIIHRLNLCQMVLDWWYDLNEIPLVYLMVNLMIYMYLDSETLVATGVRSRTFMELRLPFMPVKLFRPLLV